MLVTAAFLLVMQAAPKERPATASAVYAECEVDAVSMADERECLTAEVDRWRVEVEEVAQDTGIDAESQVLWRRLVEYDCQGEYELAGGGNSADMRRDTCLIEMQAERVSYLLRRGNF